MNNPPVAATPSARLDETGDLLEDDAGAVAEPAGPAPPVLRPLAAAVDSNALDPLVRSGRGDVTVEFRYHGSRVGLLRTERTAVEVSND